MSDTVVLDACCLINLAAAGALDHWLGDLGPRLMLPDAVLGEALFLRRAGEDAVEPGDAQRTDATREPVLLDRHIAGGLLTLVHPETAAELAAYVAFARELDDGEAMALAIAERRGWQLATDDRKAIRLAGEAGVSVLTTPAVMKRWAAQSGASAADIRAALVAIRNRVHFLPGGRDPLCDWWLEHLPG